MLNPIVDMGSRGRLLIFLTTVFLLVLTAKANPLPAGPDSAPFSLLPAPGNIQSAVNVNDFVTVALPSRVLQRPGIGGQYHIRYSTNAIRSASNDVLMSIPVPANDQRAALQAAINDGAKHSPSEMQTSFVSSANSLSVIMNSYEARTDRQPFNWQDVSSVASVLLKASPGGTSNANSFVGVVVDPEGKSIVDFVVIPTFVNVHSQGSRSIIAGGPFTNNLRHNLDTPSKLQKRILYLIADTTLTLEYGSGTHDVNGIVLRTLIVYALDMILMEPHTQSYNNVVSNPLGPVLAWEGHVVFSLRALNSQRIPREDMLKILTAIRDVVTAYVEWNMFPRTRYRSVVGRVLNNAGNPIARWSVGELLGSLDECGTVLVAHPDGTHGVGCLA